VTCSGCRRRQRGCEIHGPPLSARVVGALLDPNPRWIMRLATLASVLVLLAVPLAIEAQQVGKLWRIGYLSSSSAERERARLAAFQQGLRELGYLEGKSIFIEQRYAGGEFERLPELALLAFEAKRADQIDRAFTAIKTERPGALIVIGDPLLGSHAKRIVELSTRNRLPAIYWTREFPDAGGLMSYGTNFDDLWRQAATYVDKILNGAKPGDLPVEQPTKFELVINLKTAKALGLTIPHSLLMRADQVIDQ